jgi:hypothetical protein
MKIFFYNKFKPKIKTKVSKTSVDPKKYLSHGKRSEDLFSDLNTILFETSCRYGIITLICILHDFLRKKEV